MTKYPMQASGGDRSGDDGVSKVDAGGRKGTGESGGGAYKIPDQVKEIREPATAGKATSTITAPGTARTAATIRMRSPGRTERPPPSTHGVATGKSS